MGYRRRSRKPATTSGGTSATGWPACQAEHHSGGLRPSARADSLSFRAGRPHAQPVFAFTRYALQHPTPWGWGLGAPPPRRGTLLRAPCRGTVDGFASTSCSRVPRLRQGCGALPPMSNRSLGRPIPRGRGIWPWLPPARRRGLLVAELDARPPALRAPGRVERCASTAAMASAWPASQGRPPCLHSRPRGWLFVVRSR